MQAYEATWLVFAVAPAPTSILGKKWVVSENRVLRIIFGSRRSNKRPEKLPNEKILKLYFTPDKPKRMRLVGDVARMGEMREGHTILVGKSEGRRPLVRARN